MELIAESLGNNLSNLSDYENKFSEGALGELRIYLDRPLYQNEIDQIEYDIRSQGVILTAPIVQDARVLVIKFKKAIAPLAIIAIAVGGILAVGAGLLGWQIWKSTQLGVPLWAWLIGGAALVYLLFTSETGKQASGLAIQAGKVYVTKKVAK